MDANILQFSSKVLFKRIIPGSVIIAVMLTYLFAWFGYPLFMNDSYCFLPTAFELKQGNGLYNYFYDAGFINDNKFIFYPPLYPFFVSLLMLKPTVHFLYLSVATINVISIILSGFILKIFLQSRVQRSFYNLYIVFFSVCWIFANCSFILTANSRPEVLCRLFLYVIILISLKRLRHKEIMAGIICTLGLLTSPVFGIYLFLICVSYIFYSKHFGKLLLLAIGSGFCLLLFLLFYPFRVADLLNAMITHSGNVVFNRENELSLHDFLNYHIISNNASFGFFLFLFAVAFSLRIAISDLGKGIYQTLLLISLTVLMILIWYFAFRNLQMSYYVYVLSPLMVSLLLADFTGSKPFFKPSIAVLFSLLLTFSFIKLCFSFFSHISYSEFTLANTNDRFQSYRNMHGKRIGVSSSLWIYFAGKKKCEVYMFGETNKDDLDYLLMQQYGSGQMSAPSIDGFEIIENNFVSKSIQFAGLTISKYPPFYQYAVYRNKKY